MKAILRNIFFICLVVTLSFITIKPLFTGGFFPMHDDTQPARLYEMSKALSFGQFPVRLVPDLGYGFGYPLYNFYAPLPYYIGAIFHLIDFDLMIATKIMFAIGILMSGITMFALVREVASDIEGVVSAILYMYAPYHAVDIYVRGAVGEFYALGFLPMVLLGIIKIIKNNRKKGIIIGSIGTAGILFSHNILGMITGYFLVVGLTIYLIYLLIKNQKLFTFYFLLFTFLLGVGLSAFFTLPAIVERKYTKVEELTTGGSNFRNHYVYLDQLWNSPWGFAGSASGREDGMSFKIGKIQLILGLVSIAVFIYLFKKKRINSFQFSVFSFQFSVLFISAFLMLESSKFIWEILPGFSFIQYPWRFLTFTIFSLSFLSSVLLIPVKKSVKIILSFLIVVITIWLNAKYFTPKEYLLTRSQDYTSMENLRFRISKISDEYLPKEFVIPQTPLAIPKVIIPDDPDFKIVKIIKETPTEKIYQVESKKAKMIVANIAFFPGWKIMSGSSKEVTSYNINGRLGFYVFPAKYQLSFKLSNTPIRVVANTISLFSLFLLVYVTFAPQARFTRLGTSNKKSYEQKIFS